jgi:hypothetical protein
VFVILWRRLIDCAIDDAGAAQKAFQTIDAVVAGKRTKKGEFSGHTGETSKEKRQK